MSDATSITEPTTTTEVPAAPKRLDPAKVFAALGNPMRWEIFQMLSKGAGMSASQVAAKVKRDFDGVSKHLRLMRAAGVLASRRSEDRRLKLYYIPETILRADGVVDLGFCAIRVTARADA